ncbi:hypothetical protein Pst134EA_026630 [Puccinia striiformis f. sp. tritici]|uniref:hypothetical protein n=1 Tax=Puccinia striiformis f. sp. tritici TaxID=168172 RepID=UPI00200884A0|nr:hypothetical protein Pst134EA_026630 [Puccinia striiformis f. sp. tritici]KAH9449919.1 hypothetical protein Pst134EA_026630 [Puccinia striiformis f. sp. tritici]
MDLPTVAAPKTSQKTPGVTKKDKLDSILALLDTFNWSPKDFMLALIEDNGEEAAVKRRYYGTERGWDSTVELILSMKTLACSRIKGRQLWEDFILSQATEIVCSQKPRSGVAPNGSYHNSSTLSHTFFSNKDREARNKDLVKRMSFLYRLLCAKIQGDKPDSSSNSRLDAQADPVEEFSDEEDVDDDLDNVADLDDSVLKKSGDPSVRRTNRVQTMARTICAMVAFGLSSSRRTTHAALKALGKEAEEKLKARFRLNRSPILAPFLCYDNLDFQEKVHNSSVGHTSQMFHGTWGYIHSPSVSLLRQLDPAQLTVEALKDALYLGSKLTIRPEMFTPTAESTEHWANTLKSQITRVILRYLAQPVDNRVKLQKTPPAVHPITPEDPQISMLKLMIASDNSAQGVADVFTGIIQQSGLTAEEFHSRLHIIEGDLGSCNLLDTLKKQRVPAVGNHNSLDNVLPIPGAAHTLWNISQAIFLAHWGNEKLARDTGAWRTLHSLGVKTEKPITKKDYNLMLYHMEKVHEASLLYCVL